MVAINFYQEPRIPATGCSHCRFLFSACPTCRKTIWFPTGAVLKAPGHIPHSPPTALGCRHTLAFRPVITSALTFQQEKNNRYQSTAHKYKWHSLNRHYQAEPGTNSRLFSAPPFHPDTTSGGDEIDVSIKLRPTILSAGWECTVSYPLREKIPVQDARSPLS